MKYYTQRLLSILLVTLFISSIAHSQLVQSVDLDQIKIETKEITSPNYYPTLLSRFEKLDSTITKRQLHLLYYGKFFQPFYQPSTIAEGQEKMYELIKEREFSAALIYGKKAFNTDPLDLKTIFGISLCYHYMENEDLMNQYLNLYYGLISIIVHTGGGNSETEAMVIMNVSDEYEIASSIGKKVKKHKTKNDYYDILYFQKDEIKELNKLKRLYFNIKIPLMKISQGD